MAVEDKLDERGGVKVESREEKKNGEIQLVNELKQRGGIYVVLQRSTAKAS